jgi:hypothetical protein
MRRLIVFALLLGSLAFGIAPPAAAQSSDATPSARELWDTYPLEPTPDAGSGEVEVAPTAARTARPAQPAQSSGSGTSTVVAVMLLLVAFAVGFALAVRPPGRLSRRRPESAPEPAPSTSRPMLEPPTRGDEWSAEIEWHMGAGEGRFRAVARAADGSQEAILAESPSVEWPPSGDTSLPTLATAAEELERGLIGAGWRPLPPGDAWYAKRFTWDPVLWMPGRFDRSETAAGRRRR